MSGLSGSELFDTLTVVPKFFFEKNGFEKSRKRLKSIQNYPNRKEVGVYCMSQRDLCDVNYW